MSFVEKYKRGLALFLGTVCLAIAMYAPAKSALLLTADEYEWKTSNWIFLGLGLVFMWGEIKTFAKTVQDSARAILKKKSGNDAD